MTDYYVDPYIKKCERIFPPQGRYGYYRFDMNENPEGLPKQFVDSVLKEITPEFLSIYPEPDCFLNRYAEFVGVQYENVLATNGSDMAIRYLCEVFAQEGGKVVTVSPTFEMYRVNCAILGLNHVAVSYEDDLSIDTDKIVNAIDTDTDIVVLLNPNNPVGTAYTKDEAKRIIKKAQQMNAIVIIDEAYHYFYDQTFLPYISQFDNVVILRTFSKLFSMAACRLGVIISNPQIIEYVKKSHLTFDVNSIALKFGERILEHKDLIEQLIETQKEGKKYLLDTLKEHGYETMDGLGNYVFIRTNRNPKEIEEIFCKEKKILIKTFGNPLLAKFIRVSTGSKRTMEFLVENLLEID